MSAQEADVTRILKRLQGLIRRPPVDDRTVRSGRVPADIATEKFQMLYLLPDEDEAYLETLAILLADPRFEHFEERKPAAEALWRFLCLCYADRSHDYVTQFFTEHAREPVQATCYLPIEHLTVETTTEVTGLRLLPTTDEAVPPPRRWFNLDPPVGCVAAVPVTGTSFARMADRARARAEHGLRLLRIALRGRTNPQQLRFILSGSYAFDEHIQGWDQRPETAYALTLVPAVVDDVHSQPVAALPPIPHNKLERQADLAARWMGRAALATEPLIRLLYLFFGLEALLGDTGEGQKAGLIALRRAMLGEALGRGFVHPSGTYWLYDEVRSAAVHGSEPPEISDDEVRSFTWDAQQALADYLDYGKDHGFTRQSQLTAALDHHADRPQLIAWLRANGGGMWTKYLNKIDSTATTSPGDP